MRGFRAAQAGEEAGSVRHGEVRLAEWARAIGARVNGTCGCHITVGVKSVIGTDDPQAMGVFAHPDHPQDRRGGQGQRGGGDGGFGGVGGVRST